MVFRFFLSIVGFTLLMGDLFLKFGWPTPFGIGAHLAPFSGWILTIGIILMAGLYITVPENP